MWRQVLSSESKETPFWSQSATLTNIKVLGLTYEQHADDKQQSNTASNSAEIPNIDSN